MSNPIINAAREQVMRRAQEAVYARLMADSRMASVSMLLRRKSNIENDVLNALQSRALRERNGKIGACITVEMALPVAINGTAAGPQFDLSLDLVIYEMPTYNEEAETGTGLSAEVLVAYCMQLMQHWRPGSAIGETWTVHEVRQEQAREAKLGLVIYSIELRIKSGLGRPAKVSDVVIETAGQLPDDLVVVLTGSTDGSSIYYTTDGSCPSPDAEGTTLYAGPITTITEPCILQAAAWAEEMLGSNVTTQKIT